MKKSLLLILLGFLWTLNADAQKEAKPNRENIRTIEKGGGGISSHLEVDNNDKVNSIYADNNATGLSESTYAGYFLNTKSDESPVYGVYSRVYNDEATNPALSYAGYFYNNSWGGADSYAGYFRGSYSSSVPVGYGLYASCSGATENWAGYFEGNVNVTDAIIGESYAAIKGQDSDYNEAVFQDYNGLYFQTYNELGVGSSSRIIATGSDSGNWNSSLSFYTRPAGTVANVLERMRIDDQGHVGIATTDAESDLHINQSGGSAGNEETGGICLENGDDRWRIYNSDPFVRFNFSSDDGVTYTPKAYINNSDGSWTQLSDRSLKSNIENVNTVLPLIQQLEVKKYNYNDNTSSKKSIGLIAQDVEQIFPELVSSEQDAKLLGINYAGFSVVAIKAIQEQQEIIENVQAENADLKERLARLEAAVDALTKE